METSRENIFSYWQNKENWPRMNEMFNFTPTPPIRLYLKCRIKLSFQYNANGSYLHLPAVLTDELYCHHAKRFQVMQTPAQNRICGRSCSEYRLYVFSCLCNDSVINGLEETTTMFLCGCPGLELDATA